MKNKKMLTHRGYADVGSHGGIFFFDSGEIAEKHPGLLQIYKDKITPDLVEVEIRPTVRHGEEEETKTCKWKEDSLEGGWDGSCGIKWWLDAGTPKANGMIYCPRCGKRIKEVAQ